MLGLVHSPTPRLSVLLSAWQTGALSVLALAVTCLAGAAYLLGTRKLGRRSRRWSAWRTASFLSGLASIIVVVDSGVASYDTSNFTVHVVQHLVLMSLAPPLMALGAPITLALQSLPRAAKKALLGVVHSRGARLAVFPGVGVTLMLGSMYGYFETPLYAYTVTHPLVHDLFHLEFLVVGCLYWWPAVSADPLPARLGFGAKMASLGIGIPFMSFLGIAIMSMRTPIAPVHTLADTHAGGAVLWAFGDMFNIVAMAVLLYRWAQAEEREGARRGRPGTQEQRRLAMRAARFGDALPEAAER